MSNKKEQQTFNLTPAEVKKLARAYFAELLAQGKAPWPSKFLTSKGFHRLQCKHCHKYFWSMKADRDNCGDSECAGGYSFLHPDSPPEKRLTYLQAWLDFKKSLETTQPIGHTAIQRYPVVARWRSDVDYVAAGIYCFQPFCVTGESDPPANPLCACQFCLRFNDLDNIGITGRHYSGFNMLGIQVFNHAEKQRPEPVPPYDEIEEIFWKDTVIQNNYRWCVETLHLDPTELTYIEDVWQGGGNCGACVEYFYGGLEIGNMVFTEFAVSPKGEFSPIANKIVDVGIGLERIPWLVNGGWTSYLDVFDYCLPKLAEKLGVVIDSPKFRKFAPYTAFFDVDENAHIEETWANIGKDMGIDGKELEDFKEELKRFSDLVIICDHTRTVLYAIEDGSLPSNVGGAGNIRNVLRRVFDIIQKRGWFDKLGGVEGIINIFKMHIEGLKGFPGEFKNVRCLEDVIALEYQRWKGSKEQATKILRSFVQKYKGKHIPVQEWITAMVSYGTSPDEILDAIKAADPKSDAKIPEDLWLKFDEYRCRTAKGAAVDPYNVDGIAPTVELFNQEGSEYTYEATATVVKLLAPNKVVCDRTILYPTQGGQEHDDGWLLVNGEKIAVTDIEKVRNVVVFTTEKDLSADVVGKEVTQIVDREVRELLRAQHSATHLVAAAARRVLGPHVWQNGAKKTKEVAHIDLTHFKLPDYSQILEINRIANELIMTNACVHKKVYTRKEAEGTWGFVLYQGGAIPGNAIRVVDIDGIDTEACCGTHVDHLSQIGQIRILNYKSVQDGVFRIVFVAGKNALKAAADDMKLINDACSVFSCQPDQLIDNSKKFFEAKNTLTSQTKALTEQVINLEVKVCALAQGDAFILPHKEEVGSAFVKGLADAIAAQPLFVNKSAVIMGPTYMVAMVTPERADAFGAACKKAIDEANAKVAEMKKEAEEAKAIVAEFEGRDPKTLPDEESRRFNGARKKVESAEKVSVSSPVTVKADKPKKQQQQKKGAKAAPPAPAMVTVMSMSLSPFAIQKYITPALEALGFTQ